MILGLSIFHSVFSRISLNGFRQIQKISVFYLHNLKFSDFTKNSKGMWISVKRGVYESIAFEEILFIEADDHYLKVHCCQNKTYLIKSQITKFYERYLSKYDNFFQLSRSYLVNLDKAHKIVNNQLLLEENKTLSIPRGKKPELLKIIGAKL